MSPGHLVVPLFFAALVGVAAGCTVGDLTFHGKFCTTDRPCPGGLVCVIRPSSSTDLLGHCYTTTDAPTCPAPQFCGEGNLWVETCEADGHSSHIDHNCSTGQSCNPDIAVCADPCSATQPCSGTDTCDLGTSLCRPFLACNTNACANAGGTCTPHACVPDPSQDAVLPDGNRPSLDCFLATVPSPPSTPKTCNLKGRVTYFPLIPTAKTAGLTVTLRAPGLASPLVATAVTDSSDSLCTGGCVHYSLDGVPTNVLLDLEVSQPGDYTGDPVVTTLHAGFALRADQCGSGSASRAISVLSRAVYDSYTSAVVSPWDPNRGLLIGRITDCDNTPVQNATIGLAIPPPAPGQVYYFAADENIVRPDTSRAGTSLNGFYAAAGVPACQNEVGFLARQGTPLVLGATGFSLKPDSAVVVDLPQPSERLP